MSCITQSLTDLSLEKNVMPAKKKFKIFKHFFYKEKLRAYDVDNYRILGKSVEIKVSSKMAGYKMNLPFNAGFFGGNIDKKKR